jgi:hypothetical protein
MTTTLAWVTTSVTATGGFSALIVNRLRSKKNENCEQAPQQQEQAPQQITTETRRETWNN